MGCENPSAYVVFENHYPPKAATPAVVYDASWEAVSLQAPLPPGASSDPQFSVVASPNTAYVVLAPGWDQASSSPPPSLVVMQSRGGFEVQLGDTLHIPIDDTTFAGDCAAGSALTQAQADFLTQRVFSGHFMGLGYHAATCTTTGGP